MKLEIFNPCPAMHPDAPNRQCEQEWGHTDEHLYTVYEFDHEGQEWFPAYPVMWSS